MSPTCKCPDCPSLAQTRGYCDTHYQRWRRGTLGKVGSRGPAPGTPPPRYTQGPYGLQWRPEDVAEIVARAARAIAARQDSSAA